MINSPTFLSAHNTSVVTGIPETQLRQMIKDGRCPGYYVGRKFLINVDALVEMLDRKSRENVSDAE